MKRHILLFSLGSIFVLLLASYVSAWVVIPIQNGSFEEGTLCTVPNHWVMKTLDYTGSPPPISTYIHEVCENDTHYFSGSRSCWLHSRVVDTDGTKRDRYSWTWVESVDWINQPSATHVRFYIRDIQPTHSLYWGWNDGIYLGFNDTVWDITNYKIHIYNNGETVNFNGYNDTKVGTDGSMWYEYIYPIPSFINKSQMRVQFTCTAGDWTFYDTSYFADMSFYLDNVELLTLPLSALISPLSASIDVGGSLTFVSTVTGGTSPYSYQWYLNGNPVSGATSSSYTFTPTASGIYYVHLKVTDATSNTTQSDAARITVATVPVGGYSFPIDTYTPKPMIPYVALMAILTTSFIVIKCKTTRKTKQR